VVHDPVFVPQLGNLKSNRKNWAMREDQQSMFALEYPKLSTRLKTFVESDDVCGGGPMSINWMLTDPTLSLDNEEEKQKALEYILMYCQRA
jgi:hypothetical protein